MAMKWDLKVLKQIETAAKDGVADATNIVYDEILHLVLDTGKSGIVYEKQGRVHQASAPGEPFANDTGNALLKTVTSEEDAGLTGVISGTAEYAGYLEFGTQKMEPRPVFSPALNNKQKEIKQAINDAVKKAIK